MHGKYEHVKQSSNRKHGWKKQVSQMTDGSDRWKYAHEGSTE